MDNYSFDNKEDNINIKEEILKYIIHWRWFLLSGLLALIIAFIYLRYAESNYQTQTTILIKDDKSQNNQLMAFSELDLFGGGKVLDNEIEVLKSRTLSEITVDSLDLHISYYNEGNIKKTEIYQVSPIKVIDIDGHNRDNFSPQYFSLDFTDNGFKIKSENNGSLGEYQFGEVIKNDSLSFKVVMNLNATESLNNQEFGTVGFRIEPQKNTVNFLRNNLSIEPASKNSSVLKLSITLPNSAKGADFLNHLVAIYNEQSIFEKRLVSKSTADFISKRLDIIAEELGDVEKDVEQYKNLNNIADLETEVKLSLQKLNEFQKSVIDNEVQIKITQDLINYLKSSDTFDLIPANYAQGNIVVDEINKAIIERNKLLNTPRGATRENQVIVQLESQISTLKEAVHSSLSQELSSLKITRNDLRQKESEINTQIAQTPKKEREFRIIDRQQKVKEALYLYLLQKREETNITMAATELNAKVIDVAIPSTKAVSPKKPIILLAALILGLLIPFVVIYLINLLDTKIKTRLDIEGKTPIPFIGDIPSSETPGQLIATNSRTSSAEAIRIIRTNLEFMLHHQEGKSKTIFLTSTFSGEGKTFISANLAATIALSGKKIILVGTDLRNPKIADYIPTPNRGVSNYLSNTDIQIGDFITKVDNFDNFYVLPAGIVPPNPAELLMSSRVDNMFTYLKENFDYIIVDTAPVSLVTDTLLIAHHADSFVYVIRANKLDKKMLEIPEGLHRDKKLPNMSILLNDTDSTKGYGYGYGYGKNIKDERPIWKKILGIK
ncbi:MAG TPA: polysaccharide biosynthesis tyrosine autokinase [Flavobacterium sp.]|nr:polysaccharide biosynthesis tyrosine autokinase [Flavobacterium sp.]